MRITDVRARLVRVPFSAPVRNGTATITDRDYVVVRASAGRQLVGVSCGLARGADLVSLINSVFAPLVVDRGLHEPQRAAMALWDRATPFLGTDGQVARAISLVDMALWELHAQAVGLPMAALLGAGGVTQVPAMAASGYYRYDGTDDELAGVRREYADLAAAGFGRFKIMIGAADPGLDAERIQAAVEAADSPVGIDVNGAWRSTADADRLLRLVPDAAIEFVEEPFPAGEVDVLARFRRRRGTPVAVGEWQSDINGLRRLMSDGLIDIARLDVTAIGGVSGWLAAAPLAASYAIPILPHYFPAFHAPLVAASATALAVEVIPESSGAENFPVLVRDAPAVEKGRQLLSDRPGFGIEWDWDRIEELSTEGA